MYFFKYEQSNFLRKSSGHFCPIGLHKCKSGVSMQLHGVYMVWQYSIQEEKGGEFENMSFKIRHRRNGLLIGSLYCIRESSSEVVRLFLNVFMSSNCSKLFGAIQKLVNTLRRGVLTKLSDFNTEQNSGWQWDVVQRYVTQCSVMF